MNKRKILKFCSMFEATEILTFQLLKRSNDYDEKFLTKAGNAYSCEIKIKKVLLDMLLSECFRIRLSFSLIS